MFLSSTKICEASKTNSADPDQAAPIGKSSRGYTKAPDGRRGKMTFRGPSDDQDD